MNDTKLFLGGLSPVTEDKDLYDYFASFGTVTDAFVMRDANRISRKFGFVTFESPDQCKSCFDSSPHNLNNTSIDVKYAMPKDDSGSGEQRRRNHGRDSNSECARKIFIGGLGRETGEDSLRSYFGRYGEITDCVAMKNPNTGLSRGFGFVTFSDMTMVDAVQAERPHTIDERIVETKRAVPKNEAGPKNCQKLFVGGLKGGLTEEELEQYFSSFGVVTKVSIKIDKTGGKRGFAFVEFTDYDSVDKALLAPEHLINGFSVDVKKAVPREEQGQQKNGQYDGGYGGAPASQNSGSYGHSQYAQQQQQGWQNPAGGASSYGYGGQSIGGQSYGFSSTPHTQGGDPWQQTQPQQDWSGEWNQQQQQQPSWGVGGGYDRVQGGPMRNNQQGGGGFKRGAAFRSTPYGRGGGGQHAPQPGRRGGRGQAW